VLSIILLTLAYFEPFLSLDTRGGLIFNRLRT
jgi:hypothetical protein